MRISRKKRPAKPLIQHYRINDRIQAPEVRLLDAGGNNLGVMKIEEALARAREQELDLVEMNPKAQPPVCKIIDFTHFKYQKEKEVKKQKAKSHASETKGVRLSIRIGDHDLGIRQMQAERFLNRGDKIKIEVILRGRENARPQLAFEVINRFVERLHGVMAVQVEQPPSRQANKVFAIVAKG